MSLVDLVQTPEGTVVQVQLVFGLMMKVVPLGTVDTMGHCHKIVLEVLLILLRSKIFPSTFQHCTIIGAILQDLLFNFLPFYHR